MLRPSARRSPRLVVGAAALLVGCASSLTIPPPLAHRVTVLPLQVEGAPFAETAIRFGDTVAHDIHSTGQPTPNPFGSYLTEDRYAYGYVFGVGGTDRAAVDCEAAFGFIDTVFGTGAGADIEIRTPSAVKIQLLCNVRPLVEGGPAGRITLASREGMFNLAPTVAVSGELDLAITIQNSGVSATRGWTLSVGVDFSALTGASAALLDLRGPLSLRLSQRASAATRDRLQSLVPAFVLYSAYERLRMRAGAIRL